MRPSWLFVVVALVAACGQVTGLSTDFDFGNDAGARGEGGAGDDAAGGTGGSSGDGGAHDAGPASPIGCADGTRETFTDLAHYPAVAGCQGGFTVPGVVTIGSESPQCGRQAGNTAPNNQIEGCSVADLCAEGWHVCTSGADVAVSLALGPDNKGQCDDSVDNAFWITRQSQSAAPLSAGGSVFACTSNAHNNLVGCGPLGAQIQNVQACGPLDHYLSATACGNGSAWECGGTGGTATLTEADVVVKRSLQNGGALCCRDM